MKNKSRNTWQSAGSVGVGQGFGLRYSPGPAQQDSGTTAARVPGQSDPNRRRPKASAPRGKNRRR